MKLATTNGLAVADYFTPYDQLALANADTDLGAVGRAGFRRQRCIRICWRLAARAG